MSTSALTYNEAGCAWCFRTRRKLQRADVLSEVSSGRALFCKPMLGRQTGVVQEVTTPRTKVCPNINATQPHHPH